MAASFALRGVRVVLGDHAALWDVDLAVGAGEAVAVVGPSGAGKTTLLRVLNGVLPPTGGEVRIDGRDLGALPSRDLRRVRARLGFVHQDHALVPILRVSQNVLAGALGQRGLLASLRAMVRPRRADLERAHAALERVGVAEKLFERTDTLSGGEQQRVAIARALFQRPTALLADEPVASVDPARGRAILELLTELAREEGLTLVASLHDLELARALFPRLIGLREGRVILDAPPDQVPEAEFASLYRLEARS